MTTYEDFKEYYIELQKQNVYGDIKYILNFIDRYSLIGIHRRFARDCSTLTIKVGDKPTGFSGLRLNTEFLNYANRFRDNDGYQLPLDTLKELAEDLEWQKIK